MNYEISSSSLRGKNSFLATGTPLFIIEFSSLSKIVKKKC
jgi:hypothetical protein